MAIGQIPFAELRNPSIRDLASYVTRGPSPDDLAALEQLRAVRNSGLIPSNKWFNPNAGRGLPRGSAASVVRGNLLGAEPSTTTGLLPREAYRQAIQPQVSSIQEGVAQAALGRRPPTPNPAFLNTQPTQFSQIPGGNTVAAQALGRTPPAPPSAAGPTPFPPSQATPTINSVIEGPAALSNNANLPSWLRLSGGGSGTVADAFNLGTPGASGLGRLKGTLGPRITTGLIPGTVQNAVESIVGKAEPGSLGERVVNNTVRPATAMGFATGNPLLAAAAGAGGALNTLQNNVADKQAKDIEENTGIPSWLTEIGQNAMWGLSNGGAGKNSIGEAVLGGINKLFGGDNADGSSGDAQAQESQTPAAPARTYTQRDLTSLLNNTGVNDQYKSQLIGEYNTALAIARDNPPTIPASSFVAEGSKEANGLKAGATIPQDDGTEITVVPKDRKAEIDNAGGYTLTDEELQAAAYQSVADMIPAIRQQQQQDEDFLLQTTALQAALSPYISQIQAGYANTPAYDYLSQAASGLGPAAQNYANVARDSQAGLAQGYAAQLASIPAQLAMARAMESRGAQSAYQSQYDNSLRSAQIQAQLRQDYPELFNSGGGGDNGSISLSP